MRWSIAHEATHSAMRSSIEPAALPASTAPPAPAAIPAPATSGSSLPSSVVESRRVTRPERAEARAELRAALAIDPRNVDFLVNMALVDKADDQPERARETLIRALGFQPTHPAANYNLGLLYEEDGMTAKAYDHYTAFLAYAGPEFGSRLSDVRRKVELLGPTLNLPRR